MITKPGDAREVVAGDEDVIHVEDQKNPMVRGVEVVQIVIGGSVEKV